MSGRALPAVFLLLLAAVVGWLLLPTDSASEGSMTGLQGGEFLSSGVYTGDEPASEAASQPNMERQELEEVGQSSDDALAEELVNLRVRFVRAGSRELLTSGELWIVDTSIMRTGYWWETATARKQKRHLTQKVMDMGVRYLIDASGTTSIQIHDGSYSIGGGDATHWGEAEGSLDQLPETDGRRSLEVIVSPDMSFSVVVLDAAGAPAQGVPVSYLSPASEADLTPWEGVRLLTDADGRAHFQHMIRADRQIHRGSPDREVRVRIPMHDPPSARFHRDAPPTEDIVLRLPELAGVRVRVLQFDGNPAQSPQVFLQNTPTPEAYRPSMADGPDRLHVLPEVRRALPGNGVAEFPRVGLGVPLEVGAQVQPGGHVTWVETVSPTIPGEVLEVVLQPESEEPRISGRLLVDGTPTTERQLWFWLLWPEPTANDVHREPIAGRILDDGRFSASTGATMPPDGVDVSLVIWTSSPGIGRIWVVERLPEALTGAQDVGDLRNGLDPLVSGHVNLPADLLGVDCQVVLRLWSSPQRASAPDAPVRLWDYIYGLLRMRPDLAGDFRIAGPAAPGERLQLTVKPPFARRELKPAVVDFAPGTTGLDLEFGRATIITGRVLLDEGIAPTRIMPSLYRETEDHEISWDSYLHDTESFVFVLPDDDENLPVELRIHAAGIGQVVYRMENIQPLRGQRVDVGTIDLRGLLVDHYIEVSCDDGHVPEQFRMIRLEPGTQVNAASANPGRILGTKSGELLKIWIPGYRPSNIRLDGTDHHVILRSGLELKMTPSCDGGLPDGVTVQVQGGLLDVPAAEMLFVQSTTLDSDGSTVKIPGAGKWRFFVGLTWTSPTGKKHYRQNFTMLDVVISESGAPGSVDVPLDAERLTSWLDGLSDS